MKMLNSFVITLFVGVPLLGFDASNQAFANDCPQLPPCSGCGCRGGPGYRSPDGHCVGFRELSRVCGPNPTSVCTFENAPNTGLNRECTAHGKSMPHDRGLKPEN
jgi:hypothetical protein